MTAVNAAVCDACWTLRKPGRVPVRMKEPDPEAEHCHFCGEATSSGIYERVDRAPAQPIAAVPTRPCRMLTGHSSSDPTPDVECGRPSTHVFRRDLAHTICLHCYRAMDDDPELQKDYRALRSASVEASLARIVGDGGAGTGEACR